MTGDSFSSPLAPPPQGGRKTVPPLRIAMLGSASSPHDASRAAVFARMGHDVRMLSIADADIPGVRIVPVRGGDVGLRPLRRLALLLGTIRAIRAEDPDIWHAHYAAEYGTWAAALLRRRPLVITVMGGDVLFDEQGSQGKLGRALTKLALRRADLVLVKSNALGDVVASFGVARARIMRVIWGIDLVRFKADPAEVAKFSVRFRPEKRRGLDTNSPAFCRACRETKPSMRSVCRRRRMGPFQ